MEVGGSQILFISISTQSVSKSPLLTSKLRPNPPLPKLSISAPPPHFHPIMSDSSANVFTAGYSMRKGELEGWSVAKAQQPISSQLDCSLHTRWAFEEKENLHEADLQWAVSCRTIVVVCWTYNVPGRDTLLGRGDGRFDEQKHFAEIRFIMKSVALKTYGHNLKWSVSPVLCFHGAKHL